MDKYQGYQFPFQRTVRRKGTSAVSEDLEVGPVPTKRLWVVTNLSAEDETTAFTSLRIGVRQGENITWLMEDYSLLAGRLYWFAGEIHLSEGAYLLCRMFGNTASDVEAFYVSGFQVVQPESEHVP